ncbi:MAG: Smr/MutS family protein [Brucellaceae bacterium]|nr:Smr/MutS family protein [Brucellaceae bacterium]
MTRHHKDPLGPEDRILWNRIARTTKPMPGKSVEPDPVPVSPPSDAPKLVDRPALVSPVAPRSSGAEGPRQHVFDRTTRTKLAKGRLTLDASVDLHGLTQEQAHALLLRFLHQASGAGYRHVLVVTGKGASFGSDGILKRAVPEWLKTAPFRALVSGYSAAARNHGGEGAIYLRMRRHNRT